VEAENAELLYVTIPLSRFMTWNRSHELLNPLLQGRCFTGPEGLVPPDVAKRWPLDLTGPEGNTLAAELEIQAALIRLARSETVHATPTGSVTAVDRMRSAIAEGYNSHLTVAQVAAAAGLHPNHAMHVFKSATGSSIGEYIQCFRLAHAKRLLANTNLILPLVTVKCGFGSERRLFEVFRQEVGITPNEYRRSFQRLR
jgi:AraC-like DNA-binding protein